MLAVPGRVILFYSVLLGLLRSSAIALGVHILGEIFCVYDRFFFFFFFFKPAIEVFTFRLLVWCMLGVFLLPAFTRLGHECQDLFKSVPWNARVHRLDLGLYAHPKEFMGNRVRTHVNSKGNIPSTGKKYFSEGDRTHDDAWRRTASPTHYQRATPAPYSVLFYSNQF